MKFRMFDAEELAEILQEYRTMSANEVAKKHYCSKGTILNINKQLGKPKDMKIEWSKRMPMILHDWNAGVKTETIMKAYGINCHQTLTNYIVRWRRQGINFKSRRRVKV